MIDVVGVSWQAIVHVRGFYGERHYVDGELVVFHARVKHEQLFFMPSFDINFSNSHFNQRLVSSTGI